MGKHRKPRGKREKAPNRNEQRRYQRKMQKLRRKQTPQHREHSKTFPLGTGFAVLIGVIGGIIIRIAEHAELLRDYDTLALFLWLVCVLQPFIVVPLICRLLRKKQPDSPRAERIERIDDVLWSALLLLFFLEQLVSLIMKHFAA